MKCREAQRFLSAGLDRQLSGSEQQAVEQHLAQCAACRNELQALEADRSALLAAQAPDTPPYLRSRVMAEIRRNPAGRASPPVRARQEGLGELGVLAHPHPHPSALWRALPLAASVIVAAGGIWLGAALGRDLVRPSRHPAALRELVNLSSALDDEDSYRAYFEEDR